MQKDNNDNARRHIAYAYARIGEFADAIRVAATIEHTWRDWTYAGIAIAQWSKCDLDAAQRTIQAGPEGDLRDEILVELARARSLRADVDKALTTTRLIQNDLRRAQATLEIAAAMARQGKKQEARRLVDSINYLRIRGFDADQRRAGEQLKFDVLATWGTSTEHKRVSFSNSSWQWQWRIDGDLLAAAVRCRVALDGRSSVKSLAKPEYWDVRKAAYAQASEGEGALAWADRLPNGPRIMALVGAANGHAEYLKSAKRQPTDPIPLNPFLHALGHDDVDRELIEDR
jgi:hypothetical protein